jgi:HAD superfamily hydrolase (TIGR01450 family)
MLEPMQRTDVRSLVERYDVFFLDVYGVLVSSAGALPGAADFLKQLKAAGKTFLFVSNDASRSLDSALARYTSLGLQLEREELVCSGMLLADYYAAHQLAGKPSIVLGTKDTADYVRQAGGHVVAADDMSAEAVVIGDDAGYPLLESVNAVISVLMTRLDSGLHTHLVLPNPDLIFPRGDQHYGITAGAVAAMIEAVLRLRGPNGEYRFVPLGKPYPMIFDAALRRSPTQDKARIVMLGDQLITDVRGARDVGIDSVFVETGVGRLQDAQVHEIYPTWVLTNLLE